MRIRAPIKTVFAQNHTFVTAVRRTGIGFAMEGYYRPRVAGGDGFHQGRSNGVHLCRIDSE